MAIFKTPPNCTKIIYNPNTEYLGLYCDPIDVVLKVTTGKYDISQKDYYNLCRTCNKLETEYCQGGVAVLARGCEKTRGLTLKTEYVPRTLPRHLMVLKGLYDPYFYCEYPNDNSEFRLAKSFMPMMIGNVYPDGSFCTGSSIGNLEKDESFLIKQYYHFLNCTRNGDYNFSWTTVINLIKHWSPEFQTDGRNYKRTIPRYTFRDIMCSRPSVELRYFEPGTYECNLNNSDTETQDPNIIEFRQFLLKRIGD